MNFLKLLHIIFSKQFNLFLYIYPLQGFVITYFIFLIKIPSINIPRLLSTEVATK
jgi:hypothetical protein